MSADDPTSQLSAAVQILGLLVSAHDAVDAALEAEMRERLGISCSHFDVLHALIEAPDEQLRMVDIAEQICISRSGVTQSVDRLEELGLVSRLTTRDDRRLVLAAITPTGRALVPLGLEVIEAVAAHFITERLSERQATVLAAALAKLAPPTHVMSDRADRRSGAAHSTHLTTVDRQPAEGNPSASTATIEAE